MTPEQVAGIKKQAKRAKSKYQEMKGVLTFHQNWFNFAWDEVRVYPSHIDFIEHKQVLADSEPWYRNNALLQTAIYGMLTNQVYKLETAKFHVDKGNPAFELDLRYLKKHYYLQFGDTKYRVRVNGDARLMKFLNLKANATYTYELAQLFDKKYKHKEFSKLKDCFSFRKVK